MKYLVFFVFILFACESNLETDIEKKEDFTIQRDGDGETSVNPGEIDRTDIHVNIGGAGQPMRNTWVRYRFKTDAGYKLDAWILQYYDKKTRKWFYMKMNRSYAYLSGTDLKVKFASSNIAYKVIAAYKKPSSRKFSLSYISMKVKPRPIRL